MEKQDGIFVNLKERFRAFFSARNIAYLAVFLALVIVLQIWGGFIRIGTTPLSFVLVPIVLGGALLGVGAGTFLGFAFGVVTLVQGILTDPFTSYLFAASPVMTVLICLVKGTAAGLVSSIVYHVLKRFSPLLAVFVAAAAAPIANTGLFIIGCLMISGTIGGYIGSIGMEGTSVVYFLFILCAGVNFLIELGINLVFAPSLHRVISVAEKQIDKRKTRGVSAVPKETSEIPKDLQ